MNNNNFLTAKWTNLVMANYEVDPKLLEMYLPPGTELDAFGGKHYVSLVGFLFEDTKVKGVSVPFHRKFEEVNLRFYVKRQEGRELRRGVSFIREVVPSPLVDRAANTIYNENYVALPMRHQFQSEDGFNVTYDWKTNGKWNRIAVKKEGAPYLPASTSAESFFIEHYWGYTKLSENKTSEYQVTHPKWRVFGVEDFEIKVEAGTLYGPQWNAVFSTGPKSVLLAEGSAIEVKTQRKFF